MSSEERLEAIVDELWYIADAFVGEDENLRVLLGKLGDSVPRLWTAIDKGNPYRVALAALAVGRRFDDIFRPLRDQEGETLATSYQQVGKAFANLSEARKAKTTKSEERHDKIREAVTQKLLANPRNSIAYAAQLVAAEHQDEKEHPMPGWSPTSIKRATKGMKKPNRKNKPNRK